MAQALGYVTKTDNGGFKGTINMLSLRMRIEIVPNNTEETDRQPDFRVYTEDRVEVGGASPRPIGSPPMVAACALG